MRVRSGTYGRAVPHLHVDSPAEALLEAHLPCNSKRNDPDKSDVRRTVDDFRKDCLRELKKIKAGHPPGTEQLDKLKVVLILVAIRIFHSA